MRNLRLSELPGKKFKASKEVNQYSRDGVFIKKWESSKHVSSELGYRCNYIIMCCTNLDRRGYGFIWRYSDEVTD
jgi:hypothetical protein